MQPIDLSGKVAIVTGAGHGAGAAVARALAAAGARVAVNDINPDRAHRVAAEIRERGGAAIDVMADVSNRFQCVNLIETTRAEWDRIDLLVNCTSIVPKVSVLKMDEWELMRCVDVNLKSTFFMCQLVGRVMADRNRADGNQADGNQADGNQAGDGGGLIINLSAPEPEGDDLAAYAATQAALPAFGRACAREFAPLGIRVHTLIAPELPTPDSAEETAAEVMRIVTSDEIRNTD